MPLELLEQSFLRYIFCYAALQPLDVRVMPVSDLKVLDQILRSTLPYQHTTQPNYRRSLFSTLCSYGLLVGFEPSAAV